MVRWRQPRFSTLPDDVPYIAGRAATRISLVVPIVICLLLNALFIGRIDNLADHNIKRKWSMLQHLPKQINHLVLGDSVGWTGVLPTELSAALGGSWINLCTTAHMLVPHDAWMLQWYIEHYGPPSEVLVVHAITSWRYGVDDSTYQMVSKVPLPMGFWRSMAAPLPPSSTDLAKVFLNRYVPLYAQNKTVDQMIHKPAKDLVTWILRGPVTPSPIRPSSTDEALGYLSLGNTTNWPEYRRALATWPAMKPFELSAVNRDALLVMMQYSDRYHFPLYLTSGPVSRDILALEPGRRFVAGVHRTMNQLVAGHPYTYYLDDLPPFRAEQMRDEVHVVFPAAKTYTQLLAQRIRAERRRPWR